MLNDNKFGFTNTLEEVEEALAYRDAAIADGWTCEPTYGDHESVDRASRLKKDGFVMQIISRTKSEKWQKWAAEVTVHIWGPDGLQITRPNKYDWNAIQAGLRVCSNCGARDVDTQRFSFAGRCCAACRPEMARRYEYRGWTE